MKVLHLIQRYPPAVGGSETWCREVAQYLSAVGDQVKVLTLDVVGEEEYWREPPPDQRTQRLGRIDWDQGVLVRRYRRSLPVHTLYHLLLRVVLDRILRLYFYGPHSAEMYGRLFSEVKAADVVHLHTIPYPHNFIGYLAARLFKKRVVITPHFHPEHPDYERWSNYWLLRHCDAVIAVSDYEREYLVSRGVPRSKVAVTGNGVHLETYLPKELARFRSALLGRYGLSEATKIVVFVGRKMDYKGIDTLVAACNRLTERHDLALFLVGPGSSWFCEFYDRLTAGERQRIIDLGAVPTEEKVNLLHLAKVLVLPSRFEAFGIVLLEAWACGIPVIGSSRGALPSVVGDGGLIFQYGDAEDLAAKIDRLLADDNLAQTLALNGRRQVVERYTWDKIGQATRNAYRPGLGGQLRILICSNLFPPHVMGGAELVAYQYAKSLRDLGHDVRIFSGRLRGGVLTSYRSKIKRGEFYTTWVDLAPHDLSGDQWNFRNPNVLEAFRRALHEFSPDIVHFHNLVGLSVQMIDECHTRRIPTVMTLHDYWGICFKNTLIKNDGSLCTQGGFDCLGCRAILGRDRPMPSPVRNAHILLSLRKIDRFIAPSHYLAERYAANGIPAEWMTVLRYGVEVDRFRPVRKSNDVLTLGFIGYLGKHKGLDVLLRALSLVKEVANVRLLVVGDGEAAGPLKELCRDLHLDASVSFYGRVENRRIPAIHEKIDVLVAPSVWPENSPVTIAEAMASGIPVIASALGGNRELVEDGVTGFLVPAGDSRALAECIRRLWAQPELREEMGQRARRKIQGFSIQQQVNLLLSVYQALVQQKREERADDSDVLLYTADGEWSTALHEMFQQLATVERERQRRLLICRSDLSDAPIFDRAKLLLIPLAGEDAMPTALQALHRRVPLVVHEENEELRELCQASNAGLFYADAEELRDCVMLLLSDEPLRQELGTQGKRFVEAFARGAGSPVA